ncbi:hypothetical protein JCM8202v2_003614 [Rhodotorula sphaerocarpa]
MSSSSPLAVDKTDEKPTADLGDMPEFEELCRRFYHDQDPAAGRHLDELLARASTPETRAAYERTRTQIRNAYHRAAAQRRRAAALEILRATTGPNGGKDPQSIEASRSRRARQARAKRLEAFVRTHCRERDPGTHPFFRGLFAALWLQANRAGARCVEWRIDVAVLTEAGGQETWARDAVEAVKVVLGATERSQPPTAARDNVSRHDPNDPFLDPPPNLDHNVASPLDPLNPKLDSSAGPAAPAAVPVEERTFTLPPYLTNPDLVALLRLFPAFITRPIRRRAPAVHNASLDELEASIADVVHGSVQVGAGERAPGWKGSLSERFVLWLRRLVGLA